MKHSLPIVILSCGLAAPGVWPGESAGASKVAQENSDRSVMALLDRVDDWHRKAKKNDWVGLCDMRSYKGTAIEDDPEQMSSLCRQTKDAKRVRVLDWEVEEIWLRGKYAKVVVNTTARIRLFLFFWKRYTAPRSQYWILDGGTWYVSSHARDRWDDYGAQLVWTRKEKRSAPGP